MNVTQIDETVEKEYKKNIKRIKKLRKRIDKERN